MKPKLLPQKLFEFQDEHEKLIFDQHQAALFLLRSSEDKDAGFMKVYEETCDDLKSWIVCSYSDMTGTVIEKLSGIWNLKAEDMPVLVGYLPRQNKVMSAQESIKDVPLADLTQENIT